jgi:hypothetical protein
MTAYMRNLEWDDVPPPACAVRPAGLGGLMACDGCPEDREP